MRRYFGRFTRFEDIELAFNQSLPITDKDIIYAESESIRGALEMIESGVRVVYRKDGKLYQVLAHAPTYWSRRRPGESWEPEEIKLETLIQQKKEYDENPYKNRDHWLYRLSLEQLEQETDYENT